MMNKQLKFLYYFVALITVGSGGFYIISGTEWSIIDSIYMTIITLSTVGFTEVHPLNGVGKIWAMLVIIFGVSGFAVMVSEIGTVLLEFKEYRRRKMRKKISNLKKHYLICGFGRMGSVIAEELNHKKIPFVIIEMNAKKIQNIQEAGYYFIHGDASLDSVLLDANITKAEGIVVVLDSDQDNLFVTMSARNLNHNAYIISRCAKSDTGDKLLRAGANKVVNPYITGGHKMAELLTSPFVEDAVTIDTPTQPQLDMVLEEFNLSNLPTYLNKPIKDCQLREKYEILIVGIVKPDGETILNPGSEVLLEPNHRIIVIGSKENLDRFNTEIEYAV